MPMPGSARLFRYVPGPDSSSNTVSVLLPGLLMVAALIFIPGSADAAEGSTASNPATEWVAVVPFAGIASRPSGDVPLNSGFGGEFGVGIRGPRVAVRIVLGSSFHSIKNRGNLVLGDSVTVASNWEISWVGLDGQYAFRDGHRGRPFLSLGFARAFLTRGQNDNVKGLRFSAGAGYEYSLHHAVSLSAQVQVDQLRLNEAKAAGQPVALPEPFDETVLTLKVAVNLIRRL